MNQNGGNFPYTYLWSNGASTANISGLAPGTYSVTVTDANACEAISEVTIEAFVCSDLSIESEQIDLLCFETCEGSLSITEVPNGTAPFTFEWSTGNTDDKLDGLCAGDYSVTVTDIFNCPVEATFSITQPTALNALLSSTDETAFMANDGSASSTVSGGVGPYTYNWSNGASTESIDMLSPGIYSLTVTDANGCAFYSEIEIDPFICPDITTNANILHNPCFGDCLGSIEILEVVNGVAPYQYSWDNGSEESMVEGLCAGTYQVSITDDKNCTVKREFTVLEPDDIIITIDNVTDVTADGPGSIEISTNGDYDYSWSAENGYTSKDEDIFGLGKGCYKLVVTNLETGCFKDTIICVDDLTSTLNLWEREISIFPNPVDDKLYFDFGNLETEAMTIDLINWSGKSVLKLKKEPWDRETSMLTNEIPAGVYMVRMGYNGEYTNKKLVKLH